MNFEDFKNKCYFCSEPLVRKSKSFLCEQSDHTLHLEPGWQRVYINIEDYLILFDFMENETRFYKEVYKNNEITRFKRHGIIELKTIKECLDYTKYNFAKHEIFK